MSYQLLKTIHIASIILSLGLFMIRGALSLLSINWHRWKPLRFLPHFIDTILLISAIWLAIWIQQYPFTHAWLTAKVLVLVVYIILGSIALKPGLPVLKRATFLLLALASFAYIVGAARLHHPASWLSQYF